jgi:nitrilase
MSRGHTSIVDPTGRLIAGPVTDREEIVYAEVDPEVILSARREFDPVGHYARPDVFHLTVDTEPRQPVTFVRG